MSDCTGTIIKTDKIVKMVTAAHCCIGTVHYAVGETYIHQTSINESAKFSEKHWLKRYDSLIFNMIHRVIMNYLILIHYTLY